MTSAPPRISSWSPTLNQHSPLACGVCWSSKPVVLAARALNLVTEFDRVYHGARIMTDIRPVFGHDAHTGAKAAAIVATLKIEAHEGGGDVRPYYFALDHTDLVELQGLVDRALVKTAEA